MGGPTMCHRGRTERESIGCRYAQHIGLLLSQIGLKKQGTEQVSALFASTCVR